MFIKKPEAISDAQLPDRSTYCLSLVVILVRNYRKVV